MSVKDLNVMIKEYIDKEIEKTLVDIKAEIKELINIIDRKIEELRQYLKT
ncbi:hypothetical protein [Pyrobaculum calidifontis]|uniref:Uncharacterized protein n=1 Tax=Pyrobaculum calidifontis (strain DSM 21063 / JCM 11548 / VA1) TaxID=410359 RepID=A3MY61_PYRCJ|nr:hypothetical protein [Pyrobaculum calidifontis]ABO09578.1 conserved hypothetical protein [Pyrobaculum calidifontis JCM 11548]